MAGGWDRRRSRRHGFGFSKRGGTSHFARETHDPASNSWCMHARKRHAMPRLTSLPFPSVLYGTATRMRHHLHGCIWTVQSTRSSSPSIPTVRSSWPPPHPHRYLSSGIDTFSLSFCVFFRTSNLPGVLPKLGAISNDAIVQRRANGGICLLSRARGRMQEAHEHEQGCQEGTWTRTGPGRRRRRSARTETGTIRSEQLCQQEDALATVRKRRDQGVWNAFTRVGKDVGGRKSASENKVGKQRTRGKKPVLARK